MTEQEFISNKIGQLIREGYKKDQAAAIAYSIYNSGKHMQKAQQGVQVFDPNKPTQRDLDMYNAQQAMPQQGIMLDPNNMTQEGFIPDAELLNRARYNKFINSQQDYSGSDNYDENGNAKDTSNAYQDYTRLHIANPYTGVDPMARLYWSGQQFGKGNTAGGILGAVGGGLGIARTFMSGLGAGKENQRQEEDMRYQLYGKQPNYEYGQVGNNGTYVYQEGGKITNADMMSGMFTTDMQNPNIEVEDGEHLKNSQTGAITQAVGKTHEKGGIPVNLPDNSKVLSDFTKIGAENAKKFKKQFDIAFKASHTFADVMDKVNDKIGLNKLIEEEKEYTTKIEKQLKSSIDEATKKVNLNFLSKEMEKLQKQKEMLQPIQDKIFEEVFKAQEQIPKKSDGYTLLKQEGGDVQAEQQPSPEQIITAFSQMTGQDPQEIIVQLQQMQPEEQAQALQQMVATLQQGQQNPQEEQMEGQMSNPQEEGQEMQMREGGLYKAQEGYSFSTRYTPTLKDYTTDGSSILNQDTLDNVEKIQSYTGKGYGAKMAEVDKTINMHKWYFDTEAKKEAFKKAVLKKGSQPEVKAFQEAYNTELEKRAEKVGIPKSERQKIIDNVGFSNTGVKKLDGLFGAFTSTRPLYNFSKNNGTVEIKAETSPEDTYQSTEQQALRPRGVDKTVMAQIPSNFILPPDSLRGVYKPSINLSRLDPIKVSPESNLAAIEGQRQATADSLAFLPENQRAALLANMLGTTQASANQAIGATTQANTAQQAQTDAYNASQGDKEQLTNINLAKDYEAKMYGAIRNTDIDLRSYYDQLNRENRQKFLDVSTLNMLNQVTPNYQSDGANIYFNQASPNLSNPQVDPYLMQMYESTKNDPAARMKFLNDYYKTKQA